MPVTWQDARRSLWRFGTSPALATLWTASVGDALAGFVANDVPPTFGAEVALFDVWRYLKPSREDLGALASANGNCRLRLCACAKVPPSFSLAAIPVRSPVELDVLATYTVSLPYALGLPALVPLGEQGHGLDDLVLLSPDDERVLAIAECFLRGRPVVGIVAPSAERSERRDAPTGRENPAAAVFWLIPEHRTGTDSSDAITFPDGRIVAGRSLDSPRQVLLQRSGTHIDPLELEPAGPVQEGYAAALGRWARAAAATPVDPDDLPELAVRIVRGVRDAAPAGREPGIRAATALVEVARSLAGIRGRLTRGDVEEAAGLSVVSRTGRLDQSAGAAALVREVTLQTLYDLPLVRLRQVRQSASLGRIENARMDDTAQEALLHLWRALRSQSPDSMRSARLDLSRARAIDLETLAELSAAARRLGIQAAEPVQPLADYLVGRGSLTTTAEGGYALTSAGREAIRAAGSRARRRGALRPGDDALLAELDDLEPVSTSAFPLNDPSSVRRVLHDLMDAQDSLWSQGITPQQMAVHYLRRPHSGAGASPSLRYHTVRAIVDELASRGLLTASEGAEGLRLTAEAIRLVSVDAVGSGAFARLNWRGPRLGTGGGARVAQRRWRSGDSIGDVDLRATAAAITLSGRSEDTADRDDLTIALRATGAAPDTVVCVDVSGSMGRNRKLSTARSAAAAIARETIRRGGRVGVVAFDDGARAMAGLTRSEDEAYGAIAALKAGANTNVAGGLKGARLLATTAGRGARVILLTDGLPSAVSSADAEGAELAADLCERLASAEARRIARQGATLSVVLIGDEGRPALRFARRLAAAGRGEVRRLGR